MESEVLNAAAKTCRNCQTANLIEEIKISRCKQCTAIYCVHFASRIDPAYCSECLADVTLHKETVVKEYVTEKFDEETDTIITSSYKRSARRVKLEGMDWLFAQRRIVTMSDDELELAVEYHREILTGMLAEREDRKIKFMHRYAQVPQGCHSVSVNTDTSTKTTVKKTRTISSTKASATAASILESMIKSQNDPMALLKMLEDMQKKAQGKA